MGLAGLAGVVATGAVVVRAERRRRAYTPDEVREQLHMRFAQATAALEAADTDAEPPKAHAGIAGCFRRSRCGRSQRRR